MADYPIRHWPASYYQDSSRRWIYGQLHVGGGFIRFVGTSVSKNSPDPSRNITILYQNIVEVKKATSAFIYSALVILTSGEQHWFSSLPSRDATYTFIKHFWKGCLISYSKSSSNLTNPERSKLGAELLKIAHDSEKTLQKSAAQLHHQGVQLDYASAMMQDLHNDLDVSQKVLKHMESWLGAWRVPNMKVRGQQDPLEFISKEGIPTIIEYQVLFHKPTAKSKGHYSFTEGTLHLSVDGVSVVDNKHKPWFHYKQRDLSAIVVKSPWELVLSKYRIGEPDITCVILSTELVPLVQKLEMMFKQKVQYEQPPPGISSSLEVHHSSDSMGDLSATNILTAASPIGGTQLQVNQTQQEQLVSESETNELLRMVSRMKGMALGIQEEQDRQLHAIDKLSETVDEGNSRLQKSTRRVTKML